MAIAITLLAALSACGPDYTYNQPHLKDLHEEAGEEGPASTSENAFKCPARPENYLAEISPLRQREESLTSAINDTGDTATAIILTNRSDELDEQISAIVHRMFECDAIGHLNLKGT